MAALEIADQTMKNTSDFQGKVNILDILFYHNEALRDKSLSLSYSRISS